eukprot:CAMPEP_0197661004 /NCGR_PEP_ID=MMETSP1338-20131121/51188_1 /TAXON_ID=43686 ORGANISM="Pelagodinium beii, Strain RCC1491" /NCGR_SAMPLE_ID=MMETSP1338 /ASSEMBLY_ACC=CAM_ASM_000754 /LENGTH=318 /DNA_ID=CAMNT_0043238469 /DNA_START=48 /DNA_END=1004 /DNA_ORIENTATION=+
MVVETTASPPAKAVKADDSVKSISKMLSWLLRHGIKHRSVGLSSREAGWIQLSDILSTDYFKEVTEETLMKVIIDSNAQKPRYQLSPDMKLIRAYSKVEKDSIAGVAKVRPAKGKGEAKAAPAKPEESTGSLRHDAPAFVPGKMPEAAAPAMPAVPGYPWMYAMPHMMPYMPVQVVGKNDKGGQSARELGRIKSFNEQKGFGFIECARVNQQFGRDLFVHKAQLNGFKVGDEVTLSVMLNEAGFPQAKDLQSISGTTPGKGKEKGKGKGKSKDKSETKGKGKDGKGKGKQEGKSGGKGKKGKGKKGGDDDDDDDEEED